MLALVKLLQHWGHDFVDLRQYFIARHDGCRIGGGVEVLEVDCSFCSNRYGKDVKLWRDAWEVPYISIRPTISKLICVIRV